MKIIHKYCHQLTDLAISIDNMEIEILNEITPLLSRLKKLHLYDAFLSNLFIDFIRSCSQLESLEIQPRPFHSVEDPTVFPPKFSENTVSIASILPPYKISLPEITLSNLKTFRFSGYELKDSMETFLKSNPQLENVKINSISQKSCHFIEQNMLMLRELELKCEENENYDFNFQQNTENMILKLDLLGTSLVQKLTANNMLVEYLKIGAKSLNDINIICQMKSIKSLDIHIQYSQFSDDNFLIELAKGLPNLEKINIDVCRRKFKVSKIIQMLEYSKRLIKFDVSLRGNNDTRTAASFTKYDYNTVLNIIKRRVDHRKLQIRLTEPFTEEFNFQKYICLDMESDFLIWENIVYKQK